MVRAQVTRKLNNDKGFSLVELIIVVSILAIAAVPLMKSMGMAAKTNAKAQSIQNATSLGESIMEEVKSSSIKELKEKSEARSDWTFKNISTGYGIEMTNQKATQGEEFDVIVEINKDSYFNNTKMDADDKSSNVLSANSLLLPSIENVDTMSQAVLTSVKELDRYDNAAQSYFNERKSDYKQSEPSTAATITSKTIIIKKKDIGSYHGVKVDASVEYTCDEEYTDIDGRKKTRVSKYIRDLYSGSFIPQNSGVSSSTAKPVRFDSNIYILYSKGSMDEIIRIEDNSSPPPSPGGKDTDSHKVYFFVRREDGSDDDDDDEDKEYVDLTGLSIVFDGTAGTGTFTKDTILDDSGEKRFGKITLITNMKTDPTSHSLVEGHIYGEKAKERIYEVTVTLKKNGEDDPYATLKSTVPASETPTPTPDPESP